MERIINITFPQLLRVKSDVVSELPNDPKHRGDDDEKTFPLNTRTCHILDPRRPIGIIRHGRVCSVAPYTNHTPYLGCHFAREEDVIYSLHVAITNQA